MKNITSRVSLFLLFLLSINPLAAEIDNTREPIVIGWTGPLTGNSAVLGIDSLEAVRLVVEKANEEGGIHGRPITLIIEDDQYQTSKALSAYVKIAQQNKAVAILANTYGGVFATGQKALRDKVVVINPLDCNDAIAALPQSTFCIATESESIGRAIAAEILKRNEFPTAVFTDESNPFMTLVRDTIEEGLQRKEKPGDLFIDIQANTSDFKSQLTKAKQKDVKSIVFLGHDPMGQAMAEARKLGLQSQFYTVGTITSPGFQQLAGKSANGALVAFWEAPRSEQYEKFLEDFKGRVGRGPILDLASIPSYDAAMILIQALKAATGPEGEVDHKKLLDALYQLKEYNGLSGSITMDKDGAVRSLKEKMYVFQDGALSKNY